MRGVHVTVTTADITGEPIENVAVVGEELDRWLRDVEGFEGFVVLAREGRAFGLAFWESKEVAERHEVARAELRERLLRIANVRVEDVVDYDVVYTRLGPNLGASA